MPETLADLDQTELDKLWEKYFDNDEDFSIISAIPDGSLTFQESDGVNIAAFLANNGIPTNKIKEFFRKIDTDSIKSASAKEHHDFFSGLINSRSISLERLNLVIAEGMNPGAIYGNQDSLEIAIQQCQGIRKNLTTVYSYAHFNGTSGINTRYDILIAEAIIRSGTTSDYPGEAGVIEADKIKEIREFAQHPNDYRLEEIKDDPNYKKLIFTENGEDFEFRIQVGQQDQTIEMELEGFHAARVYLRKFQQRPCLFKTVNNEFQPPLPPTQEEVSSVEEETTETDAARPQRSFCAKLFERCFGSTKVGHSDLER